MDAGAVATCVDAEPFALRVLDDSMTPEFVAGCVVIVDPSASPEHGRFVLAEPAGAEGALVVRRLALGDREVVLEPLDARYESTTLAAAGGDVRALARRVVRGVIVQRAGTRRRHHKRYL